VLHDHGEDSLAGQQAQPDCSQARAAQRSAGLCPGSVGVPGRPAGQREVLLLHGTKVDLAAVLASRDADARALRVRDLLAADRQVGPAQAAEVMQAADVGDVSVGEVASAHPSKWDVAATRAGRIMIKCLRSQAEVLYMWRVFTGWASDQRRQQAPHSLRLVAKGVSEASGATSCDRLRTPGERSQ
jgi:hypothetical protein